MNTKLILAMAALAAVPQALHAQTAPAVPAAPAAPVTLRFQFKPGVSRAYDVVMDMTGTVLTGQSGAGIPIVQHWEMTLRQTVQDVRPSDGAATLVSSIAALKIRMNGQETDLPQSKLDLLKDMTTTVVTPAGKTLSTVFSPMLSQMMGNGMSEGAFNPTGLVETVFTLPAVPVNISDTWNGGESAASAAIAPTSTYLLKSLELSGGVPQARIKRTLTGNLTTLTTKSPISMKIMSRTTGTGETGFDTQDGTVMWQETTGNAVSTIVTKSPLDGSAVSYKMRMQTKIKMDQLFTSAVPNPAAPTQ